MSALEGPDSLHNLQRSPLEKAARAILNELPSFVGEPYPGKPDYIVSYIDCGEVDLRDLARAVLMAVRDEVDYDTTQRLRGYFHGEDVDFASVFNLVVLDILNEEPK